MDDGLIGPWILKDTTNCKSEKKLKNHNEIPQATIEKSQWNAQGYNWKIAIKCRGLQLKNNHEMPQATIEKLQWNAQG